MAEKTEITVEISEAEELQVEMGSELVISRDYESYEGPFTVTPSSAAQMLHTADRYIAENISVKAIPYTEVSNSAGGYTATIG